MSTAESQGTGSATPAERTWTAQCHHATRGPYRSAILERSRDRQAFLVPDAQHFTPVTVFGYPIAEPTKREDAEETLNRLGLSYLAERWTLHRESQTPSRSRSWKPARNEWSSGTSTSAVGSNMGPGSPSPHPSMGDSQ